MDTKETLCLIGCFVIAIVMISIPILFVCSIIYKWYDFIIMIFCLATLFDIVIIAGFLYEEVN